MHETGSSELGWAVSSYEALGEPPMNTQLWVGALLGGAVVLAFGGLTTVAAWGGAGGMGVMGSGHMGAMHAQCRDHHNAMQNGTAPQGGAGGGSGSPDPSPSPTGSVARALGL